MVRPPISCPWLAELAAGYLREFGIPLPVRRKSLWGYEFARRRGGCKLGFFVGLLTPPRGRAAAFPSSQARTPECGVFAFVRPVASRLHGRLVQREASLFRRSYELLTKYTNRRPRFEFHEESGAALIRHVPLAEFPARRRELYARNFFMETLALVVRSGLAAKLGRVRLPAH